MVIYFVQILMILLASAVFCPRRSESRRKLFLCFSFFTLVSVSGFRATSVGADTATYVALFHNIDLVFGKIRYELGFLWYVKLLHTISENTTFFLFVTSTISIGIICSFIYHHSEDPCLSVMLYIMMKDYFYQMSLMRQTMATAFVLEAFSLLLRERNRKTYILSGLFMVLAVSFHTATIVAFIPYAVWIWPRRTLINLIKPRFAFRWSVILSVTAFVLYPFIMKLVTLILPQFSSYFFGTWSDSNYFASLLKVLTEFMYLVVGVIFIKSKEELSDYDRLSLLMIICAIMIGTLSMRMEIWGRLSGVFAIYTTLLWVPSFISAAVNRTNRLVLKVSVVISSFAYMLITFIFRPEWDGVIPYAFI